MNLRAGFEVSSPKIKLLRKRKKAMSKERDIKKKVLGAESRPFGMHRSLIPTKNQL